MKLLHIYWENIENSKNEATELKLGTYQITEHIETDGPSYDDVGVTIAANNLCSVYEGYGCSRLGTYYIEDNKMICNTIIGRGEEGGIAYFEGNIIFEFEIIGNNVKAGPIYDEESAMILLNYFNDLEIK